MIPRQPPVMAVLLLRAGQPVALCTAMEAGLCSFPIFQSLLAFVSADSTKKISPLSALKDITHCAFSSPLLSAPLADKLGGDKSWALEEFGSQQLLGKQGKPSGCARQRLGHISRVQMCGQGCSRAAGLVLLPAVQQCPRRGCSFLGSRVRLCWAS